MDIAQNLKSTLDKTLEIAMRLQSINFMLYPNPRIGVRGKQRIYNISKQVRHLSQQMRTRKKKKHKQLNQDLPKRPASQIIRDSPVIKTTQFLSKALQDTNQRVRLSKAGKRTIGKLIQTEKEGPPMLVNQQTFDQFVSNMKKRTQIKKEKKHLPYVDSRTGQVQDPVVLPSFQEYLKSTGADYMKKKAKHDFFKRIQKAQEQLGRLRDQLEIRAEHYRTREHFRRNAIIVKTQIPKSLLIKKGTMGHKRRSSMDEKVDNIRTLMKSYYKSDNRYSRVDSTPKVQVETFVQAEESLEESLRNFYRSKLLHKEKFEDIIGKVNQSRPFVVKTKVKLIENDQERYKNQLESINRFNKYKIKVEGEQKQKKLLNHKQGLGYLHVLDNLIKDKVQPSQGELYLLEIWRQMVQDSWVINTTVFQKIIEKLNSKCKSMMSLIQNLSEYVYDEND